MFSGQKQSLALALTEQGITAVVMGISPRLSSPGGKRRTVIRTASLPFGAGCDLDHPQALGKELRLLLKRSGISLSRCIVGLPASFIASREKIVPTADREALRGALSIAAEREFPSGSGDLAFDYLVSPCDAGLAALLVAAPRRVIGQVVAMAQAAGLGVEAITSSTAAIALATKGAGGNGHGQPGESRMVLCVFDRQAELAVQSEQSVRIIRHLPIAMDSPGAKDALIGQLRRIIALSPGGQSAGPAKRVLLWNLAGGASTLAQPSVADAQRGETLKNALSAQLNLDIRLCSMKADLELTGDEIHGQDTPAAGGANLAQAAAVACIGNNGERIDFLHSRLTPPKVRRLGRPALWAIAAAAVVLAVLLYLFFDWQKTQQEAADLASQKNALASAGDQANAFLANMTVASGWYDRRPEFLACMKEVASVFPEEGKVWAIRVNIDEDMRVSIAGKAVTKDAVLEVLDRMESDPRFTNVTLSAPITQAGSTGVTKDVSFEINLNLQGAKR
jgi:hypothetical protein